MIDWRGMASLRVDELGAASAGLADTVWRRERWGALSRAAAGHGWILNGRWIVPVSSEKRCPSAARAMHATAEDGSEPATTASLTTPSVTENTTAAVSVQHGQDG